MSADVCGCLRMSADVCGQKVWNWHVCGTCLRSVEKVLPSGFPCVCGVCQEGESCWDTWDMSARCLRDVQPAESCLPKDVCGFSLKKWEKIKGAWDIAYGAIAGARPKFHYALHVQEQIHRWRRDIDCFAGERKRRIFKSIVARRLTRLNCFTRSTLLQMTETELTTSHPRKWVHWTTHMEAHARRGASNGARNISWKLLCQRHPNLLRRIPTW